MYWTLVVCMTLACPAIEGPKTIVVDGFSRQRDCEDLGQANLDAVQIRGDASLNFGGKIPALYRCDKTGKPPVKCLPDTRSYQRNTNCHLVPPKEI